MTLLDGETSTNGGCTAAPSFSYSAQTLIMPYFFERERYIFIFELHFQLSVTAKPAMDLKTTSLSPLLSGLASLKWLVA